MSGFIYLASPYSHPDTGIRESRFQAACKAAAALMLIGHNVFSPIAHSHPIDLMFGNIQSGAFWKSQDIPILRHASELRVLKLDGWEESSGIKWEIALAQQLHIPVTYMEPVE